MVHYEQTVRKRSEWPAPGFQAEVEPAFGKQAVRSSQPGGAVQCRYTTSEQPDRTGGVY